MKNGSKHQYVTAIIVLTLTLGLLSSVWPIPQAASADPLPSVSPMQQYVEEMQPGWNLGNTFEANGTETSWGNPVVTKEFVHAIKDQGYRSIRIPITWNHRMGDALEYIIDDSFMLRIQEVVDWCLDEGLYVMINMHHDSNWMINIQTEHDTVLKKFNAAWQQIATFFKDYPDQLMFESVNEPRFSDDWSKDEPVYFEWLDELNTSFYQIVRGSGGKNETRPLVIPGITANHTQIRFDELYKTIMKLDDPYLIATFHYYSYYPFSVNLGGVTTFDGEAKTDLIAAFDRAYDTFVSRGIPVIIGEFGLLGFDKYVGTIQHGEVLKYLEYVTYYAREKSMTHMLWDNGQHFDRSSFTWINPDFYEVMKAGLTVRSSNAQSDSIYIHRDDELNDVVIPMNLNGNSLVRIQHGDRTLEAGGDYVLEGEQLTLKAGLLRSLLSGELGHNATLTCTFSAGADWKLHVIQYEIPELRDAEGLRAMFDIPITFNGDRLATMEAVYSDGGNAGPDDWTSFKEYAKSFEPDDEIGLVQLTTTFFDHVKDGEVLLKLHFWSGTVLDYSLEINGNKIYGAALSELDDEKQKTGAESESSMISNIPGKQVSNEKDSHPSGKDRLWSSVFLVICASLGIGAATTSFVKRKSSRKL